MTKSPQHLRARYADLERLETRDLLAAFGTPWPEPRDLQISFPSDGVEVSNLSNDIESTLDQIATRQAWQELVLRAYQTWAIHADINIGLRNDYDIGFGTPGLMTDDPRFGEFRIGSIPQTGLLASSLPFQAVAGTYSGDLLLNSNESYVYHDWNVGAPDDSGWQDLDRDLFSVLLHEAGNTLGLSDSLLDWTVMYRQYTVPKGLLTAEDIAGMQAIYGARSDPFESTPNDQIQLATLLPTPTEFAPDSEIIEARGSLGQAGDVDYFQFTPLPGRSEATFRLKAAGVSLLMSRLEVVDDSGNVLGTADASSVFDNNAVVNVDGIENHSTLYLRVSPLEPGSLYAVGDYQLQIDYRTQAVQSNDPQPAAYDAGQDQLFTNYALIDEEVAIDAVDNAILPSAQSLDTGLRFEVTSAANGMGDVDTIRFTSPMVIEDRLLIHVAAIDQSLDLSVTLQDGAGTAVGVNGRMRPDGTLALEVMQPTPGTDYYLQIGVDPNSSVAVGNYVVTADFTVLSAQMNELINASGNSSVDQYVSWTASKTKLYRFDLAAFGGSQGDRAKLTIYDAHTGEMRMVLAAGNGVTRSGLAWLTQGDYILRVSISNRFGNTVDALNYQVHCDGVSDDQDEDEPDPDYDTSYPYDTYTYTPPDDEPPAGYDPGYYGYGY